MTRHSCILCLYSHFNRYYNLCDRCNNFIICYHCYKKKQTHQMKQCPNCRVLLKKISHDSWCQEFLDTLYFLRYVIFYLVFILLPSNLMLIDFPSHMNSNIFITDPILYGIMINISHIIILPFIILYYNHYIPILLSFTILNLTFLSVYLSKSDKPVSFYTVYNIIYIYAAIYTHLCIIIICESVPIYKSLIDQHIQFKELKIKIYNTYCNYLSENQV